MSSEEKDYSTGVGILPKATSDKFLDDLDINLGKLSSFLAREWKSFMQWRHEQEAKMNLFQKKRNEEFDEQIAEAARKKILGDKEKLFKFFLITNSASGARNQVQRVDAIISAFIEDWKQKNIDSKKREEAKLK